MHWWHRRRFNRRYGLMAAVWPCDSVGSYLDRQRYEAMYRKAYGRGLADAGE